ncbi:MAG: hypothetical protein KY475_11310 [Planctomycetes bacterium]|nr:hypothetical protein [Planctomycetota bacterium]
MVSRCTLFLAAVLLTFVSAAAAGQEIRPYTVEGAYALDQQNVYALHLRNRRLRAETYWTLRSLWEGETARRRNHPPQSKAEEWSAARARGASLTDFSSGGAVAWPEPEKVFASPLADDAHMLDALCVAYWQGASVSPSEVIGVLDRMLAALKEDLPDWTPMQYVAAKRMLLRLRNWSAKGFH